MAEAEDFINAARFAIEARKWSLASSYLDEACELACSDSETWEQIGCLYMKVNRDDSALKCLRRASRFAPQEDVERQAHLAGLRGGCLRELGLYDRAVQAHTASVELSPTAARYVALGRLQRSLGQLKAAIDTLAAAYASYPNHEEVLLQYGFVLAEDHPAEAVRVLAQLVSQCPESAQGHAELGYARIWNEQLVEAERALRCSMELDGEDIWPYFYLDICLAKQERPFEERRMNLLRANQVYSCFITTLLLGDLCMEWGFDEEAAKYYAEHTDGKVALFSKRYSIEELRQMDKGWLELQRWRLIVG